MSTPNGPAVTPHAALLSELAADDWGQVAVGLYDTGRLVAIAPWLAGHQARVDFLCRAQRSDGGWGGPEGYALVPTLSATAGLLTELSRAAPGDRDQRLARAATDGLRALQPWLRPDSGLAVPDTIGVELIVPALVDELMELVSRPDLPGGLVTAAEWLRLPDGFDRQLLAGARDRFGTGSMPQKSWACLEVFGPAAVAAPFVRPARTGSVGCSAAATAAWLGGASGHQPAYEFLDVLQARAGGPVPGVTPITYFEAAWVLNSLAIGGPRPEVPVAILDRLEAGLTVHGAPAAPGLPADADDTAAVLAALLRHGRVYPPEVLLPYRHDGYFVCFVGERTPSISTNAHVLETLALYLAHRPEQHERYAGPAAQAAEWLLAQQRDDGSWLDKWHASEYYATACCVQALALHGTEPARRATDRAAAWVRDSQRPDGSWGRWQGTVEETAYAVQILTAAAETPELAGPDAAAVARGCQFLADPPPLDQHPGPGDGWAGVPLWHAKDLYAPVAVVRAARLAALALGDQVGRRRTDPVRPRTNRHQPAGSHR